MAKTSTAIASGLWTADATWVATGYGTGPQSGAVGTMVNATGVFTPAVSPVWTVDALIGRALLCGGTYYPITDNDATTCTVSTPPANGDYAWSIGGKPLAGDWIDIGTAYSVTCDESISVGITAVTGELIIDDAVTLTLTGAMAVGNATTRARLSIKDGATLAMGANALGLVNCRLSCAAAATSSITGAGAVVVTMVTSGRIRNPRAILL